MDGRGFQYDALDASRRQIRLLRVSLSWEYDAANSERTTAYTLSGTLQIFDLRDSPPFRALSYTWGPPQPENTVIINNSKLRIRKNLWKFLWHYSYTQNTPRGSKWQCDKSGFSYLDGGDAYLWIDALCIDQANIPERNRHVQYMDEVYLSAVEVVVWLGESDPDTIKVMKMMKDPDNYDTSAIGHRRGFSSLLCNPYWKRLWIVQEVLLAKEITIMAGFNTLSWHNLDKCWDVIRPGEKDNPKIITDNLGALIFFRKDLESVQNLPLHEAMRHFCVHACMDPRDKIFGLLGIVRNRERIEVNYEMTTMEIFHAVAQVTATHETRAPRDRTITDMLTLYQQMVVLQPSEKDIHVVKNILNEYLHLVPSRLSPTAMNKQTKTWWKLGSKYMSLSRRS